MSSPPPRAHVEPGIGRVFSEFEGLIGVADGFLSHKQYLLATVSAQIAALYASYNHPGEFWSPALERILRRIGQATTGAVQPSIASDASRRGGITRVLHVLTAAKEVGGDSRFVWRWIQRDQQRRHSVALTYQLDFDVPTALAEGVAGTGGLVHVLDRGRANAIQRGHALRQLARGADVVFLHVYPEDVVPVIAFAEKDGLPPIVFVVQADHQYWTGVSVCDLFVHLRESGMLLSERRRSIDLSRMAHLAIPLDSKTASVSKAEAKHKLGLPEDTVLLLSIARALKYQRMGGEPAFAEVMTRITDKHRNAVVLVVGPSETEEWKAASEKTGGRVRALGQRSDTQLFYEAADIYLDSFPFTSNTSLLEAGGFGVPLVSYFPYSAESAVLGPGAPGLEKNLIRANTLADYEATISDLIEHPRIRDEKGQSSRDAITFMHAAAGWNEELEELYRAVQRTVPVKPTDAGSDASSSGELDQLLSRFYSQHAPLGWAIGWYARHLPYTSRLQLLRKMLRLNRSFTFSLFLPNWVERSVGGRLRGWRELPLVARWLSAGG